MNCANAASHCSTLNRPAQRNALGVQMRDEIATLLPRISHDAAVKALVLTGAGEHLSAGGDVSSMRKAATARAPVRHTLREVHAWLPQVRPCCRVPSD